MTRPYRSPVAPPTGRCQRNVPSLKCPVGGATGLQSADKTSVNALRLEALPDDSLPGKGPGFAGGNFVVSKLTATIQPPDGSRLTGRIVGVDASDAARLREAWSKQLEVAK